jgi:hypothetical protein
MMPPRGVASNVVVYSFLFLSSNCTSLNTSSLLPVLGQLQLTEADGSNQSNVKTSATYRLIQCRKIHEYLLKHTLFNEEKAYSNYNINKSK